MKYVENYGFLGLGQFGGNVTRKFEGAGYPCIVANSSIEDLATSGAKNKLHFKGGQGCHKNRKKSKILLSENLESLIDEVRSKLSPCSTIFVCASSAGGTGSGMLAAVAKILSMQLEKNICIVTVLPDKSENFQSYANTVELFKELETLDNIGATFILDNSRNKDRMRINDIFFSHLDTFLANKNGSDYGCLDRSEIDNLLATQGMAVIAKNDKVIDSLDNSIYAPIEPNKVVRYIGIMSQGNTSELDEVYSKYGNPIDTYVGTNSACNLCMLVGLTFCKSRLNEIKDTAQTSAEIIKKGYEAANESLFDDDLGFINAFTATPKAPKKADKKSSFDILGEFL